MPVTAFAEDEAEQTKLSDDDRYVFVFLGWAVILPEKRQIKNEDKI